MKMNSTDVPLRSASSDDAPLNKQINKQAGRIGDNVPPLFMSTTEGPLLLDGSSGNSSKLGGFPTGGLSTFGSPPPFSLLSPAFSTEILDYQLRKPSNSPLSIKPLNTDFHCNTSGGTSQKNSQSPDSLYNTLLKCALPISTPLGASLLLPHDNSCSSLLMPLPLDTPYPDHVVYEAIPNRSHVSHEQQGQENKQSTETTPIQEPAERKNLGVHLAACNVLRTLGLDNQAIRNISYQDILRSQVLVGQEITFKGHKGFIKSGLDGIQVGPHEVPPHLVDEQGAADLKLPGLGNVTLKDFLDLLHSSQLASGANVNTCCICFGTSTTSKENFQQSPSSTLLHCDGCPRSYHPECLNMPQGFKERTWLCGICSHISLQQELYQRQAAFQLVDPLQHLPAHHDSMIGFLSKGQSGNIQGTLYSEPAAVQQYFSDSQCIFQKNQPPKKRLSKPSSLKSKKVCGARQASDPMKDAQMFTACKIMLQEERNKSNKIEALEEDHPEESESAARETEAAAAILTELALSRSSDDKMGKFQADITGANALTLPNHIGIKTLLDNDSYLLLDKFSDVDPFTRYDQHCKLSQGPFDIKSAPHRQSLYHQGYEEVTNPEPPSLLVSDPSWQQSEDSSDDNDSGDSYEEKTKRTRGGAASLRAKVKRAAGGSARVGGGSSKAKTQGTTRSSRRVPQRDHMESYPDLITLLHPQGTSSHPPSIHHSDQLGKEGVRLCEAVHTHPPSAHLKKRIIASVQGDTKEAALARATPGTVFQGVPVYRGYHSGWYNSCAACGLGVSPVWRKGWPVEGAGPGSLANLCNACGLKFKEGTLTRSK